MIPERWDNSQLYLASNSPRRKELLLLIGWEYSLLPSQVDETALPGEDGMAYVKRIAKSKALKAANQAGGNGVIISADTAVIDRSENGINEIFGKPVNSGDAADMLRRLRGHTHQVLSAITLLHARDGKILIDWCSTDVQDIAHI